MKQINVKLHHISDGEYLEVWESKAEKGQKPLFFGRITHGGYEWVTLCDAPYGYCEVNYTVSDDVEFIVCDNDWNELFRDGNGTGYENHGFPSLENLCHTEWGKVQKRFPDVKRSGFYEWILSKATRPLNNVEKDNWTMMQFREVNSVIVHEFKYLGQEYAIIRVTKKHSECDEFWYGYYAGRKERDKFESYVHWYGYEFSDELSAKLLAEETIRYVLDPDCFTGRIVTTFSDGIHDDYEKGKTLEDVRRRENNGSLEAVCKKEFEAMWERWESYLQGPFREITEEQYWYWLECVPPLRHRNGSFFVSEGYTGSLHQFCFKRDGRYFTALRSKRLSNAELDSQIDEFLNKLK